MGVPTSGAPNRIKCSRLFPDYGGRAANLRSRGRHGLIILPLPIISATLSDSRVHQALLCNKHFNICLVYLVNYRVYSIRKDHIGIL